MPYIATFLIKEFTFAIKLIDQILILGRLCSREMSPNTFWFKICPEGTADIMGQSNVVQHCALLSAFVRLDIFPQMQSDDPD